MGRKLAPNCSVPSSLKVATGILTYPGTPDTDCASTEKQQVKEKQKTNNIRRNLTTILVPTPDPSLPTGRGEICLVRFCLNIKNIV